MKRIIIYYCQSCIDRTGFPDDIVTQVIDGICPNCGPVEGCDLKEEELDLGGLRELRVRRM